MDTTGRAPNDDGGGDTMPLHLQQGLVHVLTQGGHIRSRRVEDAFRAVPRHLFVPGVPLEQVYADEVIPTKFEGDRSISSSSQPAIMAVMLEQLDPRRGQRVLEIGAGTGYNAALLAHIVGPDGYVTTVDIDDDIVEGARAHLAAAGFGPDRVRVARADGVLGYPQGAPYDRIILTVNAEDVAPAWRQQLRPGPGARLVLPFTIRGNLQAAVAFEPGAAAGSGRLVGVSTELCSFMPLRGSLAGVWTEVSLPSDPDLSLGLDGERDRAIDTSAIDSWLHGPSRDLPTGVRATQREVLSSLGLWLAIHEQGYCTISARDKQDSRDPRDDAGNAGDAADRDLARSLPLILGMQRPRGSHGVLSERGLCLLTLTQRPSEGTSGDRDKSGQERQGRSEGDAFAAVGVRAYGAEAVRDGVAARVVTRVVSWDAAGRPSAEQLRLSVYPRDGVGVSPLVPSPERAVVRKRWTDLVLEWPG